MGDSLAMAPAHHFIRATQGGLPPSGLDGKRDEGWCSDSELYCIRGC